MNTKFVAMLGLLDISQEDQSDINLESIVWTIASKVSNYFNQPYAFGFSILENQHNRIHALIAQPEIAPKIAAYFMAEFYNMIGYHRKYSLTFRLGLGSVDSFGKSAAYLGRGPAYDLISYDRQPNEDLKLIVIKTENKDLDIDIEKKLEPYNNLYLENKEFLESLSFTVKKEMEYIDNLKNDRETNGGYYAGILHTDLLRFLSCLNLIGQLLVSKTEIIHSPPVTKVVKAKGSVIIPSRENLSVSQIEEIELIKDRKKEPKHHFFISYSHKDEDYLNELLTYLKPLEKKNVITYFSDKDIKEGEEWKRKIETNLNLATIFILLISQHFYDSDVISNKELPSILQKAKDKQAEIWSLIISPSLFDIDNRLNIYQTLFPPSEYLADIEELIDRQKKYKIIAEKIVKKSGIENPFD